MKEKVRILGRDPGQSILVERVVRKCVNNARYGYVLNDKKKTFVRKVTDATEKAYIVGGADWVSIYEGDIPFYYEGSRVEVTFEGGTVIPATVIDVSRGKNFQHLTLQLDTPYDDNFGKPLERYIFNSSDMAIRPVAGVEMMQFLASMK